MFGRTVDCHPSRIQRNIIYLNTTEMATSHPPYPIPPDSYLTANFVHNFPRAFILQHLAQPPQDHQFLVP